MFDVFLSHNSKDKQAVRALAALLSERGIKVWFDEDQLVPGRKWQPLMEEGIGQSRTGAVLIGADGLGPWQDMEMQVFLQAAARDNKSVIPVLLPGAPEQPQLPAFLSLQMWVDLRAGFEKEGVDKLIWGIMGEHPSRRPVPVAASPPIIAVTRLRHGADTLVGREKELARLDAAWHDPKTHVVTIVAWGGVGKTALVVDWMARMARDNWRGAERVFDWSFYSQGTSERTTASADAFIARALEFFGDREMAQSPASAWDKGERLAQLVAEHRTLLVLDGVEPLQYPPGPVGGRLKDPALEALLKGLAQHNVGLCLVTTRESVADLAPFHATTAPEWLLECLSEEAGAQLLFNMGVKKAGNADIGPGDQELKDATREIGGHALTLQLLGPYLAKAHQGNVRKRELVAFRKADAKVQGGHAFRMLSAYEKWLTGAREEGETQLAILRVLGLFDRPADAGCIAALRKKPPIRGLTERLVDLTEEDWNLTLSNLRECGLITIQRNGPSPVGSRVSLDAHPLVREYFARQMREESPDTWRASHSRLYKYLCDLPEKKSPDTFEEMEPLYAAVQHGSEAGYFKDALRKVFRQRLRRGDEQYSFRCGLAGADLAVLSSFFERHWSHVVPVFSPRDQGYILNEAGSALRTLGRLSEAEEPVRASLSMLKRIRDWKAAANTCTTLVNVLLLGGNMSGALAAAREGVEFADKSKDDYFCVSTRITLARVLHHHGETAEAMQHIRKAKRIAPNMRASSRYALQSASICDVLITRGQLREAEKWTEQALESLARVGGHPRETALHCIRLGRIHLERALKGQSECLSIAASHLRRGVEEMRKANRRDELPAALISLASLLSAEGKLSDARAYLDEAWQIAERGSMRLHMADVLLHRGRLLRDTAALAEARKLIDECGYHRRDEELIDAEEAAKGW